MSSCSGPTISNFRSPLKTLLAALNPQIDREIVRQKAQQTTSFRPKCMLKRLLGGEHTDIHEVAKELGLSSRTLHR